MNRRITALVSAVAVGSIALTGCGALKGGKSPRGIVVEREQKVNKHGGTDYQLEIATDAKTIRTGKVTKKTKTSDVNVSGGAYNNCILRDRFPSCK